MRKLHAVSLSFTFLVILSSIASASDPKKSLGLVTFNKDVAPIFYKHCVECHRPDELAPMSLLSYKDARPWARSIKEKVVTREMPPWHADPSYGRFANNPQLSPQEIGTIVAWVDQGAKEGNPRHLPPRPTFIQGWKLGKPDVVLSMGEEYTVGASGSDEYINFTMPTNFKEDVWVQAAEINPGNKKVVHHVVAFVQTPEFIARGVRPPNPQSIYYKDGTLVRVKHDAPAYDDGCAAPGGGIARGSGQEGLGLPLTFYTPGKDVDIFPPGTAKHIPAGSNIVIQMHYSKTTGEVERDRTSVGLILARSRPEKVFTSFGVLNHYFKIPPGADNHEVKGCYTFSRDVELYNYLPHMHLRGKDMKYEVVYPDGRRETLLSVPKYDFNWQTMYRLEEPVLLPKGSRMIVTAHYDNSERNKNNPDPTKTVRFGDPTYDEMMVGYFGYVPVTPARSRVRLDPKLYDRYAGEYAIMPGVVVTITRDGDRLMFSAPGQPSVEALPESETMFYFTIIDAQVTFIRDDKGDVAELLFEVNGRKIRAKRVVKPALVEERR